MTRLSSTTYADHVDADTRRLGAVASAAPASTPVHTCEGWTLADLTWHVAEVQHFWSWVVGTQASSPDAYQEPVRPPDEALVPVLDEGRERLVALLRAADPTLACWSWSGDQTAGFVQRRQAHEALVHRVDAELAVGECGAVHPELAADGVAEVLETFLGDLPSWGTFVPGEPTLTLTASDVGRTWGCRFGRMVGTSPTSGQHHDLEALLVEDVVTPTATIAAPADVLDLWLWGRAPLEQLAVEGDRDVVERLRSLVAEAAQ